MLIRRMFLAVVALAFLQGCTQGMRKEASDMRDAAVNNKISFELMNNMAHNTQAMRFDIHLAEKALTSENATLTFSDSACNSTTGPSGPAGCVLELKIGDQDQPSQKAIPSEVYSESMATLTNVYRDIAAMAGAGPVTAVKESIADASTDAKMVALSTAEEAVRHQGDRLCGLSTAWSSSSSPPACGRPVRQRQA